MRFLFRTDESVRILAKYPFFVNISMPTWLGCALPYDETWLQDHHHCTVRSDSANVCPDRHGCCSDAIPKIHRVQHSGWVSLGLQHEEEISEPRSKVRRCSD